MAENDGLTTYRKSGLHRLRDAEKLLEISQKESERNGSQSQHTRGAAYLCGYGVECMLKAYLVSKYSPFGHLSQVVVKLRKTDSSVKDICGAQGHDLKYLLTISQLEERMTFELKKR